MAFLDNSGDIILDAVLTDTGRYRLAKGDGSFRIAKFALGDDEIDYSLYNKATASAYTDLDILSTPILEAFTDNAVAVKSKLISIPRNDLLFLPVLKLFDSAPEAGKTSLGLYCVSADQATDETLVSDPTGVFSSTSGQTFSAKIIIDQGLDTTQIPFTRTIDSDLKESQYIIEMDSRLGIIKDHGNVELEPSFIDDDRIASYYVSLTNNNTFVSNITDNTDAGTDSSIRGPRGTRLQFKLQASMDLQYSDFLFQQLGTSDSLTINGVTQTLKYIDTSVRISGATTGFRLDVPVRFIKL
jgi:hypothetical protein